MRVNVCVVYLKSVGDKCIKQVEENLKSADIEYAVIEYNIGFEGLPPAEQYGTIFSQSDIIIALGGDGTIIHVAKLAAKYDKPVLGINSGHIGFMAGLEHSELGLLKNLKTGDYRLEKRMLLKVSVLTEDEKPVRTDYALNEAVISRGSTAKIVRLCVAMGGTKPIEYVADGVIVATPTGSTAYSLSAGGPVLDPVICGMVLTPLCPHSINSRSIILGPDTRLDLYASARNKGDISLCIDGEEPICVTHNIIKITRADDLEIKLIRIKNDSFYDIFNDKILNNNYC